MRFATGLLTWLKMLFFFTASSQTNSIVVINKDSDWQSVSLEYFEPLSLQLTRYREIKSLYRLDTGHLYFALPAKQPIFFSFSWDFKLQTVCAFPGDTLEFKSTPNSALPFKFSGTRPESELMFYSYLERNKLGVTVFNSMEVTDRLDFHGVATITRERYEARMRALESEAMRIPFSKRGKLTIKQTLYYQYLSELLFPYNAWMQNNDWMIKSAKVPHSYKKMLKSFSTEITKDSLMQLHQFKKFALQYARFALAADSLDPTKITLKDQVKAYKTLYNGKMRDMLLFDEVRLNFERSGETNLIPEVLDSIQNGEMRDYLMAIYKKNTSDFPREALAAKIESIDGRQVSMEQMLTSHRGKLLYLDFWATWCGPCLMEMPDSKKLTEELKNESIAFVYLSVDEDTGKWLKKAATLNNSTNSNHYRLANGTAFMKLMCIPAVPQYILIDKAGKMVSFNAPRPRSLEIRTMITEQLKRTN